MPLRLDSQSPDFAERFHAFLGVKREAAADVEADGARDHRRRAARGDARSWRTDAEVRPRRSRQDSACASARPRSMPRRRVRPQGARRAEARARPHRGLSPAPEARRRALHRRARRRDGRAWTAIEAVGLYVPGGTAAYPSSVLMNAVPAKVAGCAAPRHGGAGAGRQAQSRWCWRRRSLPASTRSIASAARRRWRRSPMAPRRSRRSPRSSGPAMPMSRRRSGWCSARSAST